jgi:hypothetical protein
MVEDEKKHWMTDFAHLIDESVQVKNTAHH